MSLPFLHVVAGLLAKDGKFFIAQRLASDSSPGKWEFPGGKVEEGEEPKEALIREWKEELGVDIQILRLFGTHRFTTEKAQFHLELYTVHHVSGTLQMIEHQAHAWASVDELKDYDLLAGDLPFVEKLRSIRL